MKTTVNYEKRVGRPKNSKSRYALKDFCAATGYSKTYAHEAVSGKRRGCGPCLIAWSRWNAAQAAAK